MSQASVHLAPTLELLDNLPVDAADPETIAANHDISTESVRECLHAAHEAALATREDGCYRLTSEGRALIE